ncbi:MAG: haloacid dehalogenase-like hydrolase [Betaproteobacteria bacterium]|nr:haloacid dehalogenase-like hydrolase [Betaproteobacteria bacterium]
MSKPRLALFDLDHTLLPLDSDYEWGEFTIRLGWCDASEFKRRNAEYFEHYRAGTLDIHEYIRFATEAIRSRGPQQAAQAHARFMDEVIRPALRPQALERVADRVDGDRGRMDEGDAWIFHDMSSRGSA